MVKLVTVESPDMHITLKSYMHSKVVGEGSEDSFVGFEEDISYSHGAIAQEAKLSLSVKLLQQDKTMVGQLHSSTCTKTHKNTHRHKRQ